MTTRTFDPAARLPIVVLVAAIVVFGAGCGSGLPAESVPVGGGRVAPAAPAASPDLLPSDAAPTGAPAAAADASPTPAAASPVMPEPTAAATPGSTATPTADPRPEPPRTAVKVNLYRNGDYVSQYTLEWCVGASLQMALNMTTAGAHTSRASQQELWEMAQSRSSSPFGGANPRGWTAALNDLGIGPYVLVSIPDYDQALRVAATAIRTTKRPVGLVMWRGRHAWVMSGFESVGDPAVHQDARITGIRVLDPLYPRGSKVWGPSPKPNSLLTPATLAKQFVIRDRGRTNLGVPPGYLLVLPTDTAAVTPAA